MEEAERYKRALEEIVEAWELASRGYPSQSPLNDLVSGNYGASYAKHASVVLNQRPANEHQGALDEL